MGNVNIKFILSRGFFPFKKAVIKSVSVPKGTDLLTAAVKAGVVLSSVCGGKGTCGKCRLVVNKDSVLACERRADSDMEALVPAESVEMRPGSKGDTEEFTKGIVLSREDAYRHAPLVTKTFLGLPRPTDNDNTSDLDRVCAGLSDTMDGVHLSADLAGVKFLGETLRGSNYKVTVTLARKDGSARLLGVEPGDTTGANYGFAFDIGTTTVAGQLIDLKTRQVLGSRIAFNKQAAFGSDVITRIIFASTPEGLDKSQKAVVANINEIIDDLISSSKVSLADTYAIVCSGNMTMMHLLLKIDPEAIRKPPYMPEVTDFPAINSAELGIKANPKSIIAFIPGVSTYVGGDIVSGVLACGIDEKETLSLLVDIGTNGELVLGNREWMIGASASAGPAFEGSGLSCGMKAVSGAIQKIAIDRSLNVRYETIGAAKARGICGSGYIDLICRMLKHGIIDRSGRINRSLRSKRIRMGADVYEYVVAFKKESATGRDIVITEDDIENLKRSKGAIYSAIIALTAKVGKDVRDIEKIYIAGGFGNYINIGNAVAIGLLPDLPDGVYEFVGNSSLAGSRMSLLSVDALERAERIHRGITSVDLSSEPLYMDEYIASLFFPHTDMGRFPSARS